MKKKILSVLLCVAMVASLVVGCGGKEEAAETPAAEATEEAETPAEESTEPVTVRLLYMSGDDNQQKMMKEMIEPMVAEKFPHVTLEIEEGGSGTNFENLVKTYNSSGDLPDIWWSGSGTTLATMETGTNLDMKPYLEADGYLDNFSSPEALEDINGKIYTLSPCTDQMHICEIYYNKEIFEANGVEVPTTWDEFLAVCETLKNNGVAPIAMAGGNTAIVAFWVESILAAINPDTINQILANEADWSHPDCVKAYECLKQLMDAGYFQNGFEACDHPTALDTFTTDNAAMFLHMAWTNASLDPEKIGAFLFPAIGEDVTTGSYVQCWGTPYNGYAVNANSENAELCVQILEAAIEQQALYFNRQGTASGYVTDEPIAEPNALLGTINNLRDSAPTHLSFLWANSMDATTVAEWNTMNSNFLVGGYTPEEMCEAFNEVYANNTWFN